MRELVSTIAPCEVEVDGHLYLVQRPTVEEALTVLAACEEVAEGEADVWSHVRRTAFAWLPIGLSTTMMSSSMPIDEAAKFLVALISMGLDKKHEEDSEKVDEVAKKIGWIEIVATYADAYNMSPSEVLKVKWPFFIAMMAQIDRLRAVEQMDNVAWYTGSKAGKIDHILRRAYGERVMPEYKEPPPEWFERQHAAIKVWKDKRTKQAEA